MDPMIDERMDKWLRLHYASGQVPMLQIRSIFAKLEYDLTQSFNANDAADWGRVARAYFDEWKSERDRAEWEAFRDACDRLGYRPAPVGGRGQESATEDTGEAPKATGQVEARERMGHRGSLQWVALHEGARPYAPEYAGDVGIDLAASETVLAQPGEVTYVPTGVAFAPPPGFWILLLGRSSLARKLGLACVPGVIDNGYRGEMLAGVYPIGNRAVLIAAGTRLVQAIVVPAPPPVPLVEVGALPPSDRGHNGFGSTGGH